MKVIVFPQGDTMHKPGENTITACGLDTHTHGKRQSTNIVTAFNAGYKGCRNCYRNLRHG